MPRALVLFVLLVGCSNQDEGGAEALWDQIQADEYRTWARPPGYESRAASSTVHGDEVEIFINDAVADALAAGAALGAWPDGSTIVKDGFQGGSNHIVVAMDKREGEWFFAEWHPDGEVVYSGSPRACTRCHGADGDGVLAFSLP